MGGRGSNAKRGHMSIQSAASCKDLKELTDYMWNTHRVYLAKSLSAADFDTVRTGAANIERLFQEFPYLKTKSGSKNQPMIKELNGKCTTANAYAEASFDGGIAVNTKYFKDRSGLMKHYQGDVRQGYHPKGTDADQILVHEAGHLLERALIMRDPNLPLKGYAWNQCTKATQVIGEACKALKKMPAGKTAGGKALTNDQLVSRVSRYATSSRSEALAECVADYWKNGSKADPLSIQVWNILKRELK